MLSQETTSAPPKVGDPAIDFSLLDTESRTLELSTLWREKPLVVVFLRHLACTFCRQQLAYLKRDYPQIAAAGANVACVAQGVPKVGKAYAILFEMEYPLLMCGDDLTIFERYGLTKANLWQIINPIAIGRAIVSTLQGHVQTEVLGDGRQLGGAFVIDTAGIVRFAHRNADVSDNVRNDRLINAVRTLSTAGK